MAFKATFIDVDFGTWEAVPGAILAGASHPKRIYQKQLERIDNLAKSNRKLSSVQELDVINQIKEGVHIKEVAKQFGVSASTIKRIRDKLASDLKNPGVYGMSWSVDDHGKRVYNTKRRTLCQIDPKTNVIVATFKSLCEAERLTKVSHIRDVLYGERKLAGKCMWKWIENQSNFNDQKLDLLH